MLLVNFKAFFSRADYSSILFSPTIFQSNGGKYVKPIASQTRPVEYRDTCFDLIVPLTGDTSVLIW